MLGVGIVVTGGRGSGGRCGNGNFSNEDCQAIIGKISTYMKRFEPQVCPLKPQVGLKLA